MRQWLTILSLLELKINLIIYIGAKLGRPWPVNEAMSFDKDDILLLFFQIVPVLFIMTSSLLPWTWIRIAHFKVDLKENCQKCLDIWSKDIFIEFLRSEETEIWNSTKELYHLKTQIDLWSKYQHEISLRVENHRKLGSEPKKIYKIRRKNCSFEDAIRPVG